MHVLSKIEKGNLLVKFPSYRILAYTDFPSFLRSRSPRKRSSSTIEINFSITIAVYLVVGKGQQFAVLSSGFPSCQRLTSNSCQDLVGHFPPSDTKTTHFVRRPQDRWERNVSATRRTHSGCFVSHDQTGVVLLARAGPTQLIIAKDKFVTKDMWAKLPHYRVFPGRVMHRSPSVWS